MMHDSESELTDVNFADVYLLFCKCVIIACKRGHSTGGGYGTWSKKGKGKEKGRGEEKGKGKEKGKVKENGAGERRW